MTHTFVIFSYPCASRRVFTAEAVGWLGSGAR